jgi:hypothetical protein
MIGRIRLRPCSGQQKHNTKIGDGCALAAGHRISYQQIGDSCVLAAGNRGSYRKIGDTCVLAAGHRNSYHRVGDGCVLAAGNRNIILKKCGRCVLAAGHRNSYQTMCDSCSSFFGDSGRFFFCLRTLVWWPSVRKFSFDDYRLLTSVWEMLVVASRVRTLVWRLPLRSFVW